MPRLSIGSRRLAIFIAVAEELHFRRAAERLHMSQPPVSSAVRSLEEDLGVKLLERSTRRVSLTQAGRVLLERGRALTGDLARLEEDVKHAAAGALGHLSVGFVGIAMAMGIADVIRRFGQAHPHVSLTLEERPSAPLQARVERGDLDIGFIRALEDPKTSLSYRLVSEEAYWLALPVEHPLTEAPEVPIGALDGEALLFFPRRYDARLYDRWLEVFTNAGISPKRVQEARSLQTELGLVRAGVGACLVTASIARQPVQGVVFRKLIGDIPTIRLFAAWRAENPHEVRDRFLQEIPEGMG